MRFHWPHTLANAAYIEPYIEGYFPVMSTGKSEKESDSHLVASLAASRDLIQYAGGLVRI